jgi:hypothetical protein
MWWSKRVKRADDATKSKSKPILPAEQGTKRGMMPTIDRQFLEPPTSSSAATIGTRTAGVASGKIHSLGCCGRFCAELKHPAFSPQEVTGQVIHGPQSFSPAGSCTLLAKTIPMAWTVSLLVLGLFGSEPPRAFFFAYLTNVTLLTATVYFLISWWNSLVATACSAMTSSQTSPNIHLMHKIVWALFAVAAPAEIVVTVGYWAMDWDGTMETALDYQNIMVHGGAMILVLIEGLAINRIPLRLRHFGLLVLYMMAYLVWTLIHAFTMIGDPTSQDDDSIYEGVLDWKSDPLTTAGYAALFIFGLAPVSFLLVYGMSLYSFPCGCGGANRRLVQPQNQDPDDATEVSTYVEMNSPSKWTTMTRESRGAQLA